MIDWLTAVVPLSCASELSLGRVAAFRADGSVEWQTEKRLPVVGSHDSRIYVRRGDFDALCVLDRGSLRRAEREFFAAAHSSGRLLEFSGCPAKFLQGHNIFGSDDLLSLCVEMVRRICDLLSLQPDADELERIAAGAVLLRRVDVTRSLALGSLREVLEWIEAAERFAYVANRGRGSFPMKRGRILDRSTLNFGAGSRHWWLKLYAKGAELAAPSHRLADSIRERERLLAYAGRLLRAEVQFNARYLRDMRLEFASSWHENTARILWDEHMAKMSIKGDVQKSPEFVDSLPATLRAVYLLWMTGEDMRSVYPARTFYRHRKALLAYDVDIAVRAPFVDRTNVVPLRRVLEAVPVGVPEWAMGTPLYFEPSRKLRSA